LRPIRIFLAEDNEADAYLVQEALRRAELECVLDVFAHGDAAVRHIESMKNPGSGSLCPDLFILDLNLPGVSGHEILQLVRREHRDTPVIIFTSSEVPADVRRALAAGASTYLRKPSDLRQFLEIGNLVKHLAEKCASASSEER
jgi:CheY-like chemotaxis protein